MRMIDKLKLLVQRRLIITYVLAIIIMTGEFGCIAYLIYINSAKTLYLGCLCFLTAWLIAITEQTNMDEQKKREAYLAAIRRINRLN